MRILTAIEYEQVLMNSLVRIGYAPDEAYQILRLRWPLDSTSVCYELEGRGLRLDSSDLDQFLWWKFNTRTFDDGEPVEAGSIGWTSRILEEALGWAVHTGRGEAIEEESGLMPSVTVEGLLAGLRSDNITVRLIHGFSLARSLGVGLRLQRVDRESVESIIGRDLSGLIGRSIFDRDEESLRELASRVVAERPPVDSPWERQVN
jgi:hypothetical protein